VVKVSYTDDGIQFSSVDQNRTFTLGSDNVLVENIPLPHTILAVYEPSAAPLEESELLKIMKKNNVVPNNVNETKLIKYGKGLQLSCLLTRTKRGLVADFIDTEVSLFYQFGTRRVKLFPKAATVKSKREEQLEKERAHINKPEPIMMEQLDYHRKIEQVDITVYTHKLTCKCGNVRWIKSSDIFQCCICKPCVRKKRNKKRIDKRKEKRREAREAREMRKMREMEEA
jgi:hypothetical protein